MKIGLGLGIGARAGGGASELASLVNTGMFTYQGPVTDPGGDPIDGTILGAQSFWLRRVTDSAEYLFSLASGNYLISADSVTTAPGQAIIRIQVRDSTGTRLDIDATDLEPDGSLAPTAFTVNGVQTRFSAITAPRGGQLTNFRIVAA